MSELPDGWVNMRLAEISARTQNIDPLKFPDEVFELYSVPSYFTGKPEISEAKDIGSTKQAVQKDDILLCKIVPHINRVWTVGPRDTYRQIASGEWIVYRNHHCEPMYLRYCLSEESFRTEFLGTSAGIGGSLTRARPSEVARIAIPIAPLAEQRRIVAKVDGLTARTARARKDLDRIAGLIGRYKERLLSLAFAGELTSAWRKTRNLAPGKEVKLGEVAERFDYGSSTKSSKKGSIPVLRMGNIQDGKLDWSDLVYTSDPDEIDKYRLQRGDVLFNRTNSPALVGKTALFDSNREAIHAGYLIRVRCGPSLLPSFLTYCLNSPMGRAYSWQVKTDGVSQSNINAKKLAAFPFWLPSLDEQTAIVSRIDTAFAWLDRVAAEHAAATKRLSKLDSAILAKAFRGELVPQDPSDEPASALLARIRAKPAAAAKTRRVRSEGTVLESRGRLRAEVIGTPKRTKGQEVSKSRQDDDVLGKPYLAGKLKRMPSCSVQDLYRVADLEVADFYKQLAWEIAKGHIIDNAKALQAA